MTGTVRLGPRRFSVEVLDLPEPTKRQDAWLVRDGVVGVADGATPLGGGDVDVGAFAAAALEALAGNAHLPAREAFAAAISSLAKDARRGWDVPSAGIAIARLRGEAAEVGVIGDCLAVAALADGHEVVVRDDRLSRLDTSVKREMRRLLDEGLSPGEVQERIQPRLRENRASMNQPGSYWIFANDPAAGEHVVTASLPVAELSALLVCSDGFARLWDTFGAAGSPAALLKLATERGLAALGETLTRFETAPESTRRHPRFSVHDDTTAVLLRG